MKKNFKMNMIINRNILNFRIKKNNYKPLKNIGVKKDNDCFLFLSINQVAFKKN
jgi:hypothetical protein